MLICPSIQDSILPYFPIVFIRNLIIQLHGYEVQIWEIYWIKEKNNREVV